MVGRALRGPRAGGNAKASLVTFLDTWQQYDVLGPEYALDCMDVPPPEEVARARGLGAAVEVAPPRLEDAEFGLTAPADKVQGEAAP